MINRQGSISEGNVGRIESDQICGILRRTVLRKQISKNQRGIVYEKHARNYLKLKKYVERYQVGNHMIVYAEMNQFAGACHLSKQSEDIILCRIVRLDEDCEGVCVEVFCPTPFLKLTLIFLIMNASCYLS